MKNREVYIWDIEVFPNLFLACFKNTDTGERKHFLITEDVNEWLELHDFISQIKGLIGFNSLGYDLPVLHYILQNPNVTNQEIYNESQRVINEEFPDIPQSEHPCPQLDLFRIWHLKNPARRSSLKDIAFSMRMETIQDLPKPFDAYIQPEEIEEVIKYCWNDVDITEELYKRSGEAISLRKSIKKLYDIDVTNLSDSSMGSELLLQFYSKETGIEKRRLKQARTHRNNMHLEDCIPDFVRFKSPEFNGILDKIRSSVVTSSKGALSEKVHFGGIYYVFGTGGIHAAVKPGIYRTDDDGVIYSADVTSYYPNIAIQQGIYPNHLGEKFTEVYNWMFTERVKYPKGSPENAALKISLNACYGKFNSQYSWLYDPLTLLRVTICGQLSLAMLCEWLTNNGMQVLLANTDGIEVKVSYDKVQIYDDICKEWERLTQFTLEYNIYKKLIIKDVNNYIAVSNGGVKRKGVFEIKKDLWKDQSALIIPKAVGEYFINGTPIEKTIREHKDIFDFYLRSKVNRGWHHELDGVVQQKTLRYLVTNKGGRLTRKCEDGRVTSVQAGANVTLHNQHILRPMHEYDISYAWYIGEASKIIEQIKPSQLQLL